MRQKLLAALRYPSQLSDAIQAFALLIIIGIVSFVSIPIALALSLFFFLLRIPGFSKWGPPSLNKYKNPKTILITGGASGIGRYLAIKHVTEGASSIFLLDIDSESLNEVKKELQKINKDVIVKTALVDVRNAQLMRSTLQGFDSQTPIDLVYANAGVTPYPWSNEHAEVQMRNTMDINVTGVLNTIYPLYDAFISRGHGQFALTASLAGYAPFLVSPYSASKACILALGRSLRRELAPHGVSVVTVCPGFLDTPMITSKFRDQVMSSIIMPIDQATDAIYNGVTSNNAVISFPPFMVFFLEVFKSLPFFIQDAILHFIIPNAPVPDTDENDKKSSDAFVSKFNGYVSPELSPVNSPIKAASGTR